MKTQILANGETLAVTAEIATQIKRAREEHPALSSTFASLRDDLSKLANQPGQLSVNVEISVTMDVKALPTVAAVPVAEAPVVIPRAFRSAPVPE